MSQYQQTERLDYLDSVRGLAALMVVFGHFINWKYPDSTGIKIASIVFNANDAVSFFFILSGMVLSYPYLQHDRKLDIGKFYVSRVFRLYPGFLVAVLVNALYANRYGLDTTGLRNLFIDNKQQFWEETFLIRGMNRFYLPGWTLTIEMIYSFFMPFLVVIGKYNRKLLPWFLLASLIMSHITGNFLFHFTLGSLLGAYFQELKGGALRQSFWYRYRGLVIVIAILFFSIRHITRISPLGSTLMYLLDFFRLDFYIFSGIASAVFIVYLVQFPKIQRRLEHPILLFYGKISYGIYLMHWVFVWATGDYWDTKILPAFGNKTAAFVVMMFVCFILSTLTATLLHYCIELPFMRLGKRLTNKMRATISI